MAAKRTPREEALLLGALLVFLLLGYYMYRLSDKPAFGLETLRGQVLRLEQELSSNKEQIRKAIESTPVVVGDPDQLRGEIAGLSRELEQMQSRIDGLRRQFAQGDSEERDLMLELTRLARLCNVKIKESKPFESSSSTKLVSLLEDPPAPAKGKTPAAPSAARKAPIASSEDDSPAQPVQAAKVTLPTLRGPFVDEANLCASFQRRLELLTLEGTFPELRAFIRGLDQLPWRVVVVHVELETNQRADRTLRSPLLKSVLRIVR